MGIGGRGGSGSYVGVCGSIRSHEEGIEYVDGP